MGGIAVIADYHLTFEARYRKAQAELAEISKILHRSGYVLHPDVYHRIYAIASQYERADQNANPMGPKT